MNKAACAYNTHDDEKHTNISPQVEQANYRLLILPHYSRHTDMCTKVFSFQRIMCRLGYTIPPKAFDVIFPPCLS